MQIRLKSAYHKNKFATDLKKKMITALISVLLTGCTINEKITNNTQQKIVDPKTDTIVENSQSDKIEERNEINPYQAVEFSNYNPIFRFSGQIPTAWKIEYVTEIESLNIYNPQATQESIREKSQIFIRYFEADRFLTLKTVDILKREETKIANHTATKYEILKKENVADFPHQPSWRNQKHQLTDIRFTENNPSLFYVFAYNPTLSTTEFEKFINSLKFHNDPESFISPLDKPKQRIIKKPFGLKVSPDNSPIQPERFNGYHTGTDFEVLPTEIDQEISVKTFCGGPLISKKYAEGYGGLAIQQCQTDAQIITVIYGHLKLESIQSDLQKYLSPGETLGILGENLSSETDYERKHLHFGIHKGNAIDIRGYTETSEELDKWINPSIYL